MTDPELVARSCKRAEEREQRSIYNWIEKWYSRKRLHSTVGYRSLMISRTKKSESLPYRCLKRKL
jgi:hypothetical protein